MKSIKTTVFITALILMITFAMPVAVYAAEQQVVVNDGADVARVTDIYISPCPEMMIVGEKAWLQAHVEPKGIDGQNILWRSSDTNIAVVDKYGRVRAVRSGVVRISAECGKKRASREIKVNIKGIITIVDDDGRRDFMTRFLPMIEEKKISISTAVVPKWIGKKEGFMSWDEIAECERGGAEVLCHTLKHRDVEPTEEMTVEEIEKEYAKARKILKEHGYNSDVLVYSHRTGYVEKAQQAAAKVFGCGLIHECYENNIAGADLYRLNRYLIEGAMAERPWELIDWVKKVKREGGWMIWELHCGTKWLTDEAFDNLEKAIDYAGERGVEIVTAQEGYERFTNK